MSALPELSRRYTDSGAARWRVSLDQFGSALERSVASRFADVTPSRTELVRYLDSLRLADLALACGCAAGNEAAWEHCLVEQRPGLYRAARALAGENGRELADSLWAELFGLQKREGRRRSTFDYFHGRSSLATWLRAILAQRHIDAVRTSPRRVSLDERPPREQADETSTEAPDLDRPRLTRLLWRAMAKALQALGPDDRVRLDYYYRDGLTLAQIGRIQGTHEATVSRALARIRRMLRKDIERRLATDHGLEPDAIARCVHYASEAGVDEPDSLHASGRGVAVPSTDDSPAEE